MLQIFWEKTKARLDFCSLSFLGGREGTAKFLALLTIARRKGRDVHMWDKTRSIRKNKLYKD
jgi:hypothetical protein